MITICPRCAQRIEIDPDTLAALQGHSHFTCPHCEDPVPVPPSRRAGSIKVSSVQAHAGASAGTPPRAAANVYRKTNRNLLILGTAATLVFGGVAAFIASRKNGNTVSTRQEITSSVIYNTYFQQLIASGATTEKDLGKVVEIHAYKDGFVGISRDDLDWEEAQGVAAKAAGAVLSAGPGDGTIHGDLADWLEENLGADLKIPAWIQERGEARILDGRDILAVTGTGRQRRVLVHWSTHDVDTGAAEELVISPEIPPADAEGWITLFDGKTLYGCAPTVTRDYPGKIVLRNGYLRLGTERLVFDVVARDVVIRSLVRKIGGQNLFLKCRVNGNTGYSAWFNGGGSGATELGIGIFQPNWADLKPLSASREYLDFAWMEFTARGDTLSLRMGDESLGSVRNNLLPQGGKISVGATRGRSDFKRIQVRILDGVAMDQPVR